MTTLEISATAHISRSADVVRRQFGDVTHHAEHSVHKGVRFEVIDRNEDRCRYRQITKVGPFKIRQDIELALLPDGPLVNLITDGQFAGGSITFTITPTGPDSAEVLAEFQAPLNLFLAPLAPLLRTNARKALIRALVEDKTDLETGGYSEHQQVAGTVA